MFGKLNMLFSLTVLGSINYMVNIQGCTSTNVCNYIDQLLPSSYINFVQFTCNTAPLPVTVTKAHNTAWSIRLSLVPLLLGLTISKLIWYKQRWTYRDSSDNIMHWLQNNRMYNDFYVLWNTYYNWKSVVYMEFARWCPVTLYMLAWGNTFLYIILYIW